MNSKEMPPAGKPQGITDQNLAAYLISLAESGELGIPISHPIVVQARSLVNEETRKEEGSDRDSTADSQQSSDEPSSDDPEASNQKRSRKRKTDDNWYSANKDYNAQKRAKAKHEDSSDEDDQTDPRDHKVEDLTIENHQLKNAVFVQAMELEMLKEILGDRTTQLRATQNELRKARDLGNRNKPQNDLVQQNHDLQVKVQELTESVRELDETNESAEVTIDQLQNRMESDAELIDSYAVQSGTHFNQLQDKEQELETEQEKVAQQQLQIEGLTTELFESWATLDQLKAVGQTTETPAQESSEAGKAREQGSSMPDESREALLSYVDDLENQLASERAANAELRETEQDLRDSLGSLKGKKKKEDDVHNKVGDGSKTVEEAWKEGVEEVVDEEPPANERLEGELKSQALIIAEQSDQNEMLQAELIADKAEIEALRNELAECRKKSSQRQVQKNQSAQQQGGSVEITKQKATSTATQETATNSKQSQRKRGSEQMEEPGDVSSKKTKTRHDEDGDADHSGRSDSGKSSKKKPKKK